MFLIRLLSVARRCSTNPSRRSAYSTIDPEVKAASAAWKTAKDLFEVLLALEGRVARLATFTNASLSRDNVPILPVRLFLQSLRVSIKNLFHQSHVAAASEVAFGLRMVLRSGAVLFVHIDSRCAPGFLTNSNKKNRRPPVIKGAWNVFIFLLFIPCSFLHRKM